MKLLVFEKYILPSRGITPSICYLKSKGKKRFESFHSDNDMKFKIREFKKQANE